MLYSIKPFHSTQVNISKGGKRYHRAAEVGTAEVGTAEVGTAEVGTAEVGTAEVGTAEVGTAEVGTAEVGITEVWPYVWMLFPPLIPYLHSFLELAEMFLVCHRVVSSSLALLAALPRQFLTSYYL